MEIKRDTITVIPATFDPDGKPLEPEQAPAVHRFEVSAPLDCGGRIVRPDMPGSFDYETTAGELAVNLRFRCSSCAHFNVKRWRKFRRECEWGSKMELRQWVNEIRFNIERYLDPAEREKHSDSDGELDIEHAMDALGMCDAYTDEWSRRKGEFFPVLLSPLCGCPSVDPLGNPQAPAFKPKDRAAEKASSEAYDSVLGMARGKAPDQK